jgi:hypothetical protein
VCLHLDKIRAGSLIILTADGEHKGAGQASSKQNAKEEAAKAAYHELGW